MNRLQSDLDAAFRLELMGHMLTDLSWGGYEHHHAFDELIYVQKGQVSLIAEGKPVPLRQGEMILIPESTVHCVTAGEPSAFLYVGFRTNMADLSSAYLQVLPKDFNADGALLALQLDEIASNAFEQRRPFSDFSPAVMGVLIPALLSLSRRQKEEDPKVILSNKIKKYIHHHMDQPIRVDEIAASLYHSPHYLGSVFAGVNGLTIKEYALQFKMQRALWLLQNERCGVSDAAARLGYDSAHYFSKCFKQHFGISPSKLNR